MEHPIITMARPNIGTKAEIQINHPKVTVKMIEEILFMTGPQKAIVRVSPETTSTAVNGLIGNCPIRHRNIALDNLISTKHQPQTVKAREEMMIFGKVLMVLATKAIVRDT